jgi:hypothetical protein
MPTPAAGQQNAFALALQAFKCQLDACKEIVTLDIGGSK